MTIDDAQRTDRQLMDDGQNLGEAFHDLDVAMLAKLTPEERAVQHKLRFDLHMYVDRVWEEPRRTLGKSPVEVGGYGAAGGLRDLLDALLAHVDEVQREAGDVPEDFSVKVVAERVE